MRKKRFLFTWEKQYTMTCAQCGRKIDSYPLWFWERKEDRIRELQPFFCHTIDLEMISQIPTLSQNDWVAGQKWNGYRKEFVDENEQVKPREAYEHLLSSENGPPQIFLKHGIFPLIHLFTETELKLLHLLLCVDLDHASRPKFFVLAMRISRTAVSNIFKKLRKWKMLVQYRTDVKGRARGRQRAWALTAETRARLEKDLSDFDFFRNDLRTTFRPIGLCYRELPWRQSVLQYLEPENQQHNSTTSVDI